jgi:hypothetical protein
MPSRAAAADLGAHLAAQLGVEVRQRLVEQEGVGVADDRPAHRDPLALAAGQVGRLAVEVLGELEQSRRPRTFSSISSSELLQPQREGDVLVDGQVRVERVVLEHHRQVAVAGRLVVDPRSPPMSMSPEVMSSRPTIMRSSVDFPQPDGPTRIMNSPSAMSRLTSFTALEAVAVLLDDVLHLMAAMSDVSFLSGCQPLTAPEVRPATIFAGTAARG